MMSGLLLKFWLLKCAFRRLSSSIRGNNSAARQRSAHLGENKRITSEPQKSIGLFIPIFIITPSSFFPLITAGERNLSDELEFGSRDGKPSLEKNRGKGGGWKSGNKMFFYPIRHFLLLSKLLMCAVQIDCGPMLISTHRKFEALFRKKKPKVWKETINALLIKPVMESIRCYYFSYSFHCNRHVRKKTGRVFLRGESDVRTDWSRIGRLLI